MQYIIYNVKFWMLIKQLHFHPFIFTDDASFVPQKEFSIKNRLGGFLQHEKGRCLFSANPCREGRYPAGM